MEWLALGAVGLAGYLLGSVPFGLVLVRLAGLGDIRQVGSGNIGATNVLRTGRRDLALATLLLDSGKGAIAVLLARWLIPGTEITAAAGALLGHLYPVWLGFRGGKGVATTLGTLLALAWPVGAVACLTWLFVAALFRISSLAALVGVAVAPAYAGLVAGLEGAGDAVPILAGPTVQGFVGPWDWAFALGVAAIVWWKHRANLARLRAGTEPRIGRKVPAPDAVPGPQDAATLPQP